VWGDGQGLSRPSVRSVRSAVQEERDNEFTLPVRDGRVALVVGLVKTVGTARCVRLGRGWFQVEAVAGQPERAQAAQVEPG